MKSSIFPLILLLLLCFTLPLIFKVLEGVDGIDRTPYYNIRDEVDLLTKNTDGSLRNMSRNAYLNDISKNEYASYYDYLRNKTNSSYDYYVDEQILANGESVSAYMRSMRPTADNETDMEIQKYETLLGFFIKLFKKYSEGFTSARRVQDLSTNAVYDISANYELYNKEGNLGTSKHDETKYSELLDDLRIRFEDLKKQKPATCNESIKCIADAGTSIGEKLCCGQTGVLQNTNYICPVEKPTCSSFKCGSQFGHCI